MKKTLVYAAATGIFVLCLSGCGASPGAPETPAWIQTPDTSESPVSIQTTPGGGVAPASDGAVDCSESHVTLVYAGRSYRLTDTCYDYDEQKLAQGELLYGPDKGTPNIHMWGCGHGVMVSVFGNAPTLPGTARQPVVKVRMPGDPDERPSVDATVRVASMGAPGDMIAASFEATMSPKLNEPAAVVRGNLCVKRMPDRSGP